MTIAAFTDTHSTNSRTSRYPSSFRLTSSFTTHTMSTPEEQKNLAVISEYFSGYWGKANPEIVDKLCADNFVINYPMHGPRYGKEAAKKMLAEFKEVRTTPTWTKYFRRGAD